MILDLFQRRRKKLFCRRVKSAENLPQCEDSQKTIYGINFAYTSSFPHCHCCLCCTILKNLRRAFFFSRDLAFKPLALNGLCQYHHSKWIYQQRYFFENMFFFTSSWWWKCWWWERTETEIEFVGNFSLLFPRVHCFPCYSIEIEFVRNISRSSIQCTLAHHTKKVESM